MPRARRKPKHPMNTDVVVRSRPADEAMMQSRALRYGATAEDWRDQRWDSTHGRMAIRGERAEKMAGAQRAKLRGRDRETITRDQYEAAVKYLDIRMAFLRAYGAPGLPRYTIDEDATSCPICGAFVKCEPCAANWQEQISNALDAANRAIRHCGPGSKEAVNVLLLNPAASSEFRPEEHFAGHMPAMRIALDALVDHFGLRARST